VANVVILGQCWPTCGLGVLLFLEKVKIARKLLFCSGRNRCRKWEKICEDFSESVKTVEPKNVKNCPKITSKKHPSQQGFFQTYKILDKKVENCPKLSS
jgi:hypothetical protein